MTNLYSQSEDLNYRVHLGETKLALDIALSDAKRPIVSSKFGADSAVFLHVITNRLPNIPIVRVQTGYESRATQEFVDQMVERLGLNLCVFRPEGHRITIPPPLEDPGHAYFTETVKLEPFRRALASLEADVWLSSIRRYQSDHRSTQPVFRTLPSGILKVSPLLGWSKENVARYAAENRLPTGPDVFDPTKGEPFRECGLHLAKGA